MESARQRILTWRSNPTLFIEQAFGAQPQPWQGKALDTIRDHDRLAIRSGHGVGKSAFLSWLILWWLTTRYPAKVACTAPTAHQLFDVLWSEAAAWLRKMPEALRDQLAWSSEKIVLAGAGNESFAVARTSRKEQPEALQGFHSPHMLFLVDEASGVDDIVFEVAQGAMSTPGAKVVLTGNPTRTSGYFFDAFHGRRGDWQTMRVSCEDAPKTVSQKFVEEIAESYGRDSNVFRVRVQGEFPTEEDDAVIPLHLIEGAIDRDVANKGGAIMWGLDVARFGDDRTALAKRQGNTLLEPITSWQGKDTMQTVGMVVDQYRALPPSVRPRHIVVDSIGIGAGVADRLIELGLPAVGINVAERPSVKERYMRLRDELWFAVREWLDGMDVAMPNDSKLVGELTAPKFKFTSAGKLQVEPKEELKKRGQRSPDLADALCLTFAIPDVPRINNHVEIPDFPD